MPKKLPTPTDIDRVMNWCMEGEEEGSHYPGMSYEQGVKDAIMWIQGDKGDAPDEG